MSDSETPQFEYVTLVSGDGFEFIVPRSTACVSGTIRRMLDPSSKFSEALTGRCVFENLSGVVLEKVCEYFCYNEKNKNQANVPDMDIPPELCLELLMAADYLDT
ncbi:BTB/POZ protein [Aspergillus tetrazonus]